MKLGNVPEPGDKDRRFRQRNKAFDDASHSLQNWKKLKETDGKAAMKDQIIRTAKNAGFFSVWMEVFKEEPEMKNALLEAFPGTETRFFDLDGNVKPILHVERARSSNRGCYISKKERSLMERGRFSSIHKRPYFLLTV